MQEAKVKEAVERAIDLLKNEQGYLIMIDATERAISHYLALYLMKAFSPDYDVDVEYNRDGYDPKRLDIEPLNSSSDETRAVTVYPDVIVHKRGTNDQNLLVLEMKKREGDLAYDKRKLQAFRRELGYKYAAHIIIGCEQNRPVGYPIWIEDHPSPAFG
jgi:hypothetical protein